VTKNVELCCLRGANSILAASPASGCWTGDQYTEDSIKMFYAENSIFLERRRAQHKATVQCWDLVEKDNLRTGELIAFSNPTTRSISTHAAGVGLRRFVFITVF
jgi:hypothetical protein